jgi:Cu+-exporting ATPase
MDNTIVNLSTTYSSPDIAPETAVDPVCGMTVVKQSAQNVFDHSGTTYYFCSRSCRDRFAANPQMFLDAPQTRECCTSNVSHTAAGAPQAIADAWYTCPMDPEVRQKGPGTCPKCGMALEPETPAPLAERVEYVCPMHPEVVSDSPGICPKCGMALEPRTVTIEEANPELVDMTRRFWISKVFTVPVYVLAM